MIVLNNTKYSSLRIENIIKNWASVTDIIFYHQSGTRET